MSQSLHPYRSHTCGAPRLSDEGKTIRLSGWVHRKRDHGQLLFIDLRDRYGMTQCVINTDSPHFKIAEGARPESVLTLTGKVVARTAETINAQIPTGEIEMQIEEILVESACDMLPMQVYGTADYPEETRLTYRYLDLRREKMLKNIKLRCDIIAAMRRRMIEQGFLEIATPILTASSPEGARDYLVPSRVHPGKFYALPQAPQQFKQLLMVAGFDKYFQIAPCFRDEDARADRSPGEFYQLDFEMSFATQEDVFDAIEPVLHGIFEEFGKGRTTTPLPFPRIAYEDAMLEYGSDKPDLRNPLKNSDVTEVFRGGDFGLFAKAIEKGSLVRAIPAPKTSNQPRSFFDKMNDWAREQGFPGLGYINFSTEGEALGPIAKFLDADRLSQLKEIAGLENGDAVFFACGSYHDSAKLAGIARDKVGTDLDLLEKDVFKFCWVIDYPMFEFNEDEQKIDFSHNPFSMPQGGLEALKTQDPQTIKAYQYDIVCNGVELSSGAIRNHSPEIMYKAFEIAGYTKEDVEKGFGGMLNAFKYGAPPHGGAAPGVDRIVMLLADEPNIREVIPFPLNQRAEDLLMRAPAPVSEAQLKELCLALNLPLEEEEA